MNGVVVRNIRRADAAVIATLGRLGVATFTRHKGAPVSCNRTYDRCGAVPGSQAVR